MSEIRIAQRHLLAHQSRHGVSCHSQADMNRREFFRLSAAVASITALAIQPLSAIASEPKSADAQSDARKPTEFQHACMTLPYSAFPLERALTGIKSAGFQFVAWGTKHREANGEQVPVLADDAPPEKAKELGKHCRELGLEPVMMFSNIYPEQNRGLEVLTQRIKQAAAAGIAQVLTFGHTQGGNHKLWVERFKTLGPIARDHGVLIVVKQHGGSTGTGEACAEIIREVNDAGILVNYDAGNVMDYLNLDPIPDIQKCAR
ncbi:MAG: family glycosyltransferase, partial [Planctomycetaceae bacterium]|nr:family glycosyltransferase [Planctomycetaceae bacterium]